MSSLSEQIDRLARITKSIATIAANTCARDGLPSASQPFTFAVLDTPLGDLIRDIDLSSELGLFKLVRPSHDLPKEKESPSLQQHEIQRVEFLGATPLRRPVRGNGTTKALESEPEIYAQAAMKYINRYQNIRPMPRAYSQVEAVMERLKASRIRIIELQEQVQQAESTLSLPPQNLADEEQHKLELLQERITLLKQQRDSLSRKHLPKLHLKRALPRKVVGARVEADQEENTFWTTPTSATRIFQLSNSDGLLMDEHVDLAEISVASFGSPPVSYNEVEQQPTSFSLISDAILATPEAKTEAIGSILSSFASPGSTFSTPPHQIEPSSPSPLSPLPETPKLSCEDESAQPSEPTPKKSMKRNKIKVNSEVERILSRIWSTIGDIVMPGREMNPSSSKHPGAKFIITHLQFLAHQSSVPPSPSATSISSLTSAPTDQPSFQQIMTAHLLLQLLNASPSYALPLNAVKDTLSTKSAELRVATTTQGSNRILYTCVAKRLLKIERSRGEQTVRFDFTSQ